MRSRRENVVNDTDSLRWRFGQSGINLVNAKEVFGRWPVVALVRGLNRACLPHKVPDIYRVWLCDAATNLRDARIVKGVSGHL